MKSILFNIVFMFFFSSQGVCQEIQIKGKKKFPVYLPSNLTDSFSKDPWQWPDSMEDGTYIQYFLDDTTKIACYGSYYNNKREGSFTCFYPNGNKSVNRVYNNGKIILDSVFFEDGNPKFLTKYLEGELILNKAWYENGNQSFEWTLRKYIEWCENGSVKTEKNYIGNKLDGEFILFDCSGNLLYRGIWSNGEQVGLCLYLNKWGKMKKIDYSGLPRNIRNKIKVESY